MYINFVDNPLVLALLAQPNIFYFLLYFLTLAIYTNEINKLLFSWSNNKLHTSSKTPDLQCDVVIDRCTNNRASSLFIRITQRPTRPKTFLATWNRTALERCDPFHLCNRGGAGCTFYYTLPVMTHSEQNCAFFSSSRSTNRCEAHAITTDNYNDLL